MKTRMKHIRDPKPLVTRDHDLRLLRQAAGRRFPRLRQFLHLKRILSLGEKRILQTSLLVFMIGFFWAGYATAHQYRTEVPAVGGRYVEVVGSPQLINPLFAQLNDVDMDIARLVYSGLMRYDENSDSCLIWRSRRRRSAKTKTYTFELRQDVRWHDGEVLTADDVVLPSK